VKNTLRLRLRVRKVEDTSDDHVHVDAELQATEQTAEPTKERIIQIGIPQSDEERVGQHIASEAFVGFQKMLQQKGAFLMQPPKPLSAWVCLYITKEYFNFLGRPTVDDYIELTALTARTVHRGR
jgi:hypothetical protein